MFQNIPLIAAILPWPILGAVLKHQVLDGSGPIWPYMMFSCLVAALWNPRAAMVLGAGILGAQIVESQFTQPLLLQVGLFTTIAFISFALFDKVAAMAAALVSLTYASILFGIPWFAAVVVSEFILIFGLIGAAINGPTSGNYRKGSGPSGLVDGFIPGAFLIGQFLRDTGHRDRPDHLKNHREIDG